MRMCRVTQQEHLQWFGDTSISWYNPISRYDYRRSIGWTCMKRDSRGLYSYMSFMNRRMFRVHTYVSREEIKNGKFFDMVFARFYRKTFIYEYTRLYMYGYSNTLEHFDRFVIWTVLRKKWKTKNIATIIYDRSELIFSLISRR